MSVSSREEECYSRILKHYLGHWTKQILQTFVSVRKQLEEMVHDGEPSWGGAWVGNNQIYWQNGQQLYKEKKPWFFTSLQLRHNF